MVYYFLALNIVHRLLIIFVFNLSYLNCNSFFLVKNMSHLIYLTNSVRLNSDMTNELTSKHISHILFI